MVVEKSLSLRASGGSWSKSYIENYTTTQVERLAGGGLLPSVVLFFVRFCSNGRISKKL